MAVHPNFELILNYVHVYDFSLRVCYRSSAVLMCSP